VFSITGSLAAGQTATVTYQVRVDDPDNGNQKLNNYLEPTGSHTPPACAPGSTLCTDNVSAHRPSPPPASPPAFTGLLVDPQLAIAIGAALLLGGLLLSMLARRRRTGERS
jgi:hypothetical protein